MTYLIIIILLFLIAHLVAQIPTKYLPREGVRKETEYVKMGFYILKIGKFQIHFSSLKEVICFLQIEPSVDFYSICICNIAFCYNRHLR